MTHLSEKANELYEEYIKIYKKPPRGWAHGEETIGIISYFSSK